MNSGSVHAGETQQAPHCVQPISGSAAYKDFISESRSMDLNYPAKIPGLQEVLLPGDLDFPELDAGVIGFQNMLARLAGPRTPNGPVLTHSNSMAVSPAFDGNST